jgi:hypothetical protein
MRYKIHSVSETGTILVDNIGTVEEARDTWDALRQYVLHMHNVTGHHFGFGDKGLLRVPQKATRLFVEDEEFNGEYMWISARDAAL